MLGTVLSVLDILLFNSSKILLGKTYRMLIYSWNHRVRGVNKFPQRYIVEDMPGFEQWFLLLTPRVHCMYGFFFLSFLNGV